MRWDLAVHFIADDQGAFTGALGMLFDASPLLGAPRSKVSRRLLAPSILQSLHVGGRCGRDASVGKASARVQHGSGLGAALMRAGFGHGSMQPTCTLQHGATSARVRSEPSDADTDHTLPYRQRYVAIVEDDTITYLADEPNPGEVTITAAEKVLPWV